jgi:hypothetical protein
MLTNDWAHQNLAAHMTQKVVIIWVLGCIYRMIRLTKYVLVNSIQLVDWPWLSPEQYPTHINTNLSSIFNQLISILFNLISLLSPILHYTIFFLERTLHYIWVVLFEYQNTHNTLNTVYISEIHTNQIILDNNCKNIIFHFKNYPNMP